MDEGGELVEPDDMDDSRMKRVRARDGHFYGLWLHRSTVTSGPVHLGVPE